MLRLEATRLLEQQQGAIRLEDLTMTNTTKLSDRVRPNSEAAPWVIEEIKRLEAELARLQQPSLTLTGHMLREALGLIAPDGTDEQLECELVLVKYQDGAHSGPGIYAHYEECPEEGATLIDGESELGAAFVPATSATAAVPEVWRSTLEAVTSSLRDLNSVQRENIDDDMEEPEIERERCDETDELVERAERLLASVSQSDADAESV